MFNPLRPLFADIFCALFRLVSGGGDIKMTKDGQVLLKEMVRRVTFSFVSLPLVAADPVAHFGPRISSLESIYFLIIYYFACFSLFFLLRILL